MARQIQLKIISQDGDAPDLSYKVMLYTIMKVIPEGVDYEQMGVGLKFLGKIKEADDVIVLDDDEYQLVSKRVKAHKWPQLDQVFMDFMNTVLDAEEVEEAV